MAKKQTRRSISIRGSTHDRLQVWCAARSVAMSEFVEARIAEYLDRQGRAVPAPAARAAETTGKCLFCRRPMATPADLERCSSLPELRPPGTTQISTEEADRLCWIRNDAACRAMQRAAPRPPLAMPTTPRPGMPPAVVLPPPLSSSPHPPPESAPSVSQVAVSDETRCKAPTASGERCTLRRRLGSLYCNLPAHRKLAMRGPDGMHALPKSPEVAPPPRPSFTSAPARPAPAPSTKPTAPPPARPAGNVRSW